MSVEKKISVIMPSLNVVKYISECMDSVINQTLKDIEIICVDAGSTDGTLEVLQEYAKKDDRIQIIHSEKKSYGYQMNIGFAAAKGEYLGIVETDDFCDSNMFEELYKEAITHDVDVVKSGFYYYWSTPEVKDYKKPIASSIMCNRVFCPTTDFKAPYELVDFFNFKPTIWSGLYKRSFIENEKIVFNETPGAAFQDASFNFKVWACAKKVKLHEECYLHYRQDNENNSVHSQKNVYSVCDEYDEMTRFLDERPSKKGMLFTLMNRLKYDSYIWNYERLGVALQREFILKASEDFEKTMTLGGFDKNHFPYYKWHTLIAIIQNPIAYHNMRKAEKNTVDETKLQNIKDNFWNEVHSVTNNTRKKRSFSARLKGKMGIVMYTLRTKGLKYTIKKIIIRLIGGM